MTTGRHSVWTISVNQDLLPLKSSKGSNSVLTIKLTKIYLPWKQEEGTSLYSYLNLQDLPPLKTGQRDSLSMDYLNLPRLSSLENRTKGLTVYSILTKINFPWTGLRDVTLYRLSK